ncbi:AzlD domain-containing protein [Candidatus Levibacter sp. Uisw_134_01]|uniref:AzlD domain-containing protein n=1 Tax=Candidatus Levibacter sp. Uisw_134_01 TaxID=3230999 RepID=UPI003D3B2A08
MTWLTIVLCGFFTFLIRFIPLSGIISKKLYPNIKSSLQYIPLVVLTPIIFNGLSIFENNIISISENFKLYSAIIAVLAAIVFNNVLITITLGMLSFLLMSNFLNI